MAIDNEELEIEAPELKRTTFGSGLLKGLGITLRHMVSRSVTIQYPDEMDILPPRSRGVIALKTENCTVCMLCARECPDWCIYIEGHKESRQPVAEGKRAKKFNVLDRFAIDYALCMYCGICVEVCPYDALFWSPEFEYAEHDITELTHEMERLNDWMYKVLPPAPLDEGAQGPALAAAAPAATATAPSATAPTAAAPAPATAPTPATTPDSATGDLDPDEVHKAVLADELAKGSDPEVAEARAKAAATRVGGGSAASVAAPAPEDQEPTAARVIAAPKDEEGTPVTPSQEADLTSEAQEALKTPEPTPQDPAGETTGTKASAEEAAQIRQQVLDQELAKGSDPRVAEARAKAAEMRAIKGTTGPKQG